MNVSLLLDMAAEGFVGRVVVGDRRDGISAVGLQERAARAAEHLQSAGATALVYVAVNGPALPVALFAAARAGIPLVPLNYRLGRQQLDQLLARHHGAACIADPQHAEAVVGVVERDALHQSGQHFLVPGRCGLRNGIRRHGGSDGLRSAEGGMR